MLCWLTPGLETQQYEVFVLVCGQGCTCMRRGADINFRCHSLAAIYCVCMCLHNRVSQWPGTCYLTSLEIPSLLSGGGGLENCRHLFSTEITSSMCRYACWDFLLFFFYLGKKHGFRGSNSAPLAAHQAPH